MATMQVEAKRVNFGNSLNGYDNTVTQITTQISMIRSQLAAMKTTLQGDSDFDENDVAEITAVQLELQSRIQTAID